MSRARLAATLALGVLVFALAGGAEARPMSGGATGRRKHGVIGEEKLTAEELAAVEELAAELGIEARWLLGTMAFESRINPAEVNKITRATGLIQFMPSTARHLGTTVEELGRMSILAQLPWVRKFFYGWAGKLGSFADTYLAVFYPIAVGRSKPDSFELFRKGSREYAANSNMDADGDGIVTRGDVLKRISRVLVKPDADAPSAPAPAPSSGAPLVVLGDSLGVGVGQALAGLGRKAQVGAVVSTIAAAAPGQFARLGAPQQADVLLVTATNDLATSRPVEDVASSALGAARRILDAGARRVVLFAPRHPTAAPKMAERSAELARLLGEHQGDDYRIAVREDPEPAEGRTKDGIHYLAAGSARVARALLEVL